MYSLLIPLRAPVGPGPHKVARLQAASSIQAQCQAISSTQAGSNVERHDRTLVDLFVPFRRGSTTRLLRDTFELVNLICQSAEPDSSPVLHDGLSLQDSGEDE